MTTISETAPSHPHGHLVHLYGADDRALVVNVTRYLVQGLRDGDGLVIVATPEHTRAFEAVLGAESGYADAVREGRVVWLDAEDTLARFMANGEPHWSRFLAVVGEVVRGVQERGGGATRVRAYGEMVGLLWARGQHASAARLEEYWNRLLEATGCSLFCAYPVDVFGPEFSPDALDVVLSQHTHVVAQSDHLESALSRAIEDVLGSRVESLRHLADRQPRPEWAHLPPAEGLALWVRRHFRIRADEIMARARDYYHAASA